MKLRHIALAALCAGAPYIVSCSGGETVSPDFNPGGAGGGGSGGGGTIVPTSVPGAAGASTPKTGGAGTGASTMPGTTGQAGTAGTPSTTGTPTTTGAAGAPATTGTAGTAVTTGAAGAPATNGAAGATTPPTTGAAGAPATNGAAGATTPPTTGAAGAPATTGAAGATTPPTTGAAGAPGSAGTPGSAGAPGTAGTTGAAGSTSVTTAGATIVPLYTDPSDASWNAIVAAKQAHPTVSVIAIVNPSNGPGSSASSGYTAGIAKLAAANIKVIGYVATGYAANATSSLEAQIDQWKAFYPQVSGIFFDEQSNQAANVGYYRTLSLYAKGKGLSYTVGNPGTDTAEAYIGALDTMLIYESGGLPSTTQMAGWHAKYPPSNFGVIPYATGMNAQFVKDARKYVGYVYLQSDSLPNPWDSLPSYFADLLAALE